MFKFANQKRKWHVTIRHPLKRKQTATHFLLVQKSQEVVSFRIPKAESALGCLTRPEIELSGSPGFLKPYLV